MLANQSHSSVGSTSVSLLQRAKKNDPAAWERIVRLYGPLVYAWCRRSKLQETDLADVFQEVFASAAGSLASFRLDREGATFRGWLRVITTNKVRDHFRRRAAQPPAEGGSEAQRRLAELSAVGSELPSEPNEKVASAEVRDLFERALGFLRETFEPQTWRAFWRTAIDGLPAPEVAQELGMSPAAVRKAKSRVLSRLRAEYGELIG